MPLKEQSVKKQAVSGYYFSIASIKSSKESSNYNKIACFAGVNDTGKAPEKSNIFANIRKKSKSLLGLSTGGRRSCLKKKTRGEKSGGTVPLNSRPHAAAAVSARRLGDLSLLCSPGGHHAALPPTHTRFKGNTSVTLQSYFVLARRCIGVTFQCQIIPVPPLQNKLPGHIYVIISMIAVQFVYECFSLRIVK
jgi:hypothetical protein